MTHQLVGGGRLAISLTYTGNVRQEKGWDLQMCNLAGTHTFAHETYNFQMGWTLTSDDPPRYELILSASLPGGEPIEMGRIGVTGYILHSYTKNRNLRQEMEQIVERAIKAGELVPE